MKALQSKFLRTNEHQVPVTSAMAQLRRQREVTVHDLTIFIEKHNVEEQIGITTFTLVYGSKF